MPQPPLQTQAQLQDVDLISPNELMRCACAHRGMTELNLSGPLRPIDPNVQAQITDPAMGIYPTTLPWKGGMDP